MNAEQIVARLREIADNGTDSIHPVKLIGVLSLAAAELERLDNLINTPHTAEFLRAVKLEAAHQRERWASEHDAGKTDADWFWLVGYLAGKALHKPDRQVHHIITTAAALLNWHAHKTGSDTRMRPGIAEPSSGGPKHG